jgi:hypothetical protein
MRRLVISTDGYTLGVEQCELSGLEVMSVLSILSRLLDNGEFPYPGDPPMFELPKPSEPKKEN